MIKSRLLILYCLVCLSACVNRVATPTNLLGNSDESWLSLGSSRPTINQIKCSRKTGPNRWIVTQESLFREEEDQRRQTFGTPEIRSILFEELESRDVDERNVEIVGGWLVARFAGEFGGGLYWVNAEKSESKKLLDAPVYSMTTVDSALFAFASYCHGFDIKASIYRVANFASGDAAPELIKTVDECPVVEQESQELSLLFANRKGVFQLFSDGKIESVYKLSFRREVLVRSVAKRGADIYLGMNGFVLRLSPTRWGYREEWLVSTNDFCPA